MKRDKYTVNEEKVYTCGKGKTTYKNTYSEPENPLYDSSPAMLMSSIKVNTKCPDNCDKVDV